MIGQHNLLDSCIGLVKSGKYPRFSIITGQRGSGKKLLSTIIANELVGKEHTVMVSDVKIDTMRDVISQATTVTEPYVFIIPDADEMSVGARNSILKLVEEPPNQVYIIMTLRDTMNTLDTIISRAIVYSMEHYTASEIVEYANQHFTLSPDDISIIKAIATVPYEVDLLVNVGITEFMAYVHKVYDKIAQVEGANAFKIGNKLAFKRETDKYDLLLFWKAFNMLCVSDLATDPRKCSLGVQITSKYVQDLRISGVNLSNTFDMWVLDIRKAWIVNEP